MAYRLAPTTPMVLAKDPQGHLRYHYQHNPVIPWLSDEQREHFLRNGLVEELADSAPTAVATADEPSVDGKPRKTAPTAAWVDYGITQGHERSELESLGRQELIDLLS